MQKIQTYAIFLMCFVALISCQQISNKEAKNADELVTQAKASVRMISAADFGKVVTSGEHFYLIDCREPEEFDSACIQNAINIPRGVLENEITNKAPKHQQTVYIYCDNGNRSTLAAEILPMMKYREVYVIEGGFDVVKSQLPQLVENAPVRAGVKKAAIKASGGCGG